MTIRERRRSSWKLSSQERATKVTQRAGSSSEALSKSWEADASIRAERGILDPPGLLISASLDRLDFGC